MVSLISCNTYNSYLGVSPVPLVLTSDERAAGWLAFQLHLGQGWNFVRSAGTLELARQWQGATAVLDVFVMEDWRHTRKPEDWHAIEEALKQPMVRVIHVPDPTVDTVDDWFDKVLEALDAAKPGVPKQQIAAAIRES